MRLSVRKDDPGYSPTAQRNAEAFLDGKKVDHCFTADEETGEVFLYRTDKDGHPYRDPENPDRLATERLTGEVEIRWKKKPKHQDVR